MDAFCLSTVEDGGIFVAHIARCGTFNFKFGAVEDGGIKMSHTHTNLLFHIVFTTEGRLPLISSEIKHELFAYLAALIREKKGIAIIINGMADHVHILVMLPPDVSVSDVMRFVKANSSRWMKGRSGKPFAWQKGFGAFSVSRSNVEAVAKYIRDQEKHHQKIDLRDEYLSLLKKHEARYDPDHLWD